MQQGRLIIPFIVVLLALFVPSAKAAIQCFDCHGTASSSDFRPVDASYRTISSGGFPGNHQTHLDAPASPAACEKCHPGSSSYPSSHRDGKIKISSRIKGSPQTTPYHNSTSAFSQTATPTLGSCANVNCHFETASPLWGSSPAVTNCTTCHSAPPAGTAGNSYAGGAAGSHAKHDSYYSGLSNCSKCHADHASEPKPFAHATSIGNRQLQIRLRDPKDYLSGRYTSATRGFYLPSEKASHTFGSCIYAYCHSPGTQANFALVTLPNTNAQWGGSLDCAGCHKSGTASADAMDTGSHPSHMYKLYSCTRCHAATATGAMAIKDVTKHVNKRVDIAFDGTSSASNGFYNNSSALPATPYAKRPGATYAACSTTYCHSTGQSDGGIWPPKYTNPVWGSYATGKCGTCHGVTGSMTHGGFPFPVQRRISTGSHNRHLVGYTLGISDNDIRCAICHAYDKSQFVSTASTCTNICHNGTPADMAVRKHVNYAVDVNIGNYFGATASYNGTTKPGDGYSTCSNTYCHSSPISLATGTVPANTSPAWGSGAMACNGCHGNKSYGDYRKAFPLYTTNRPGTKANSHKPHLAYSCEKCHFSTTTNGTAITGPTAHVDKQYSLTGGSGATFTYTFNTAGGSCSSISCHGTTNAQWGTTGCLDCHSVVQGKRAAVSWHFSGYSHHVQGTVTDAHCYQCHWEANSDGSINQTWHNATVSGAAVRLVIYSTMQRPGNSSKYFIAYTANGKRAQIQKLNTHCLGCHSDQNNTAQPFGDGKTPKQYAWDGSSVASRYSQGGATSWGKYTSAGYPNAARKKITKAFSAHANAGSNQRGWNTTTGVDGTITDSSGAVGVQCYDCHSSHGSYVGGITSRYSSATGRQKGGILKRTVRGLGGYSTTYKPLAAGSAATKNIRNPGASICIDCHLSSTAKQAPFASFKGYTTPWGYTSTYGASQAIIGYWDSPYLAPGTAGPQVRYPYKNSEKNAGGHFGAYTSLSSAPMASIGGLCTPCHDPHGVSPTLGADQKYGVPLLKGTWITSPYKEDAAPAANTFQTALNGQLLYHIDQNTFGSDIRVPVTGITQTVNQSSGLCLGCHSKGSLTDGVTHAWKSKDRVHESVKGWKTANATVKHNYSCSKCHSAHNGSALPRLMVTNCLDSTHKGQVNVNPSPVTSGSSSGSGDYGGGSGSGRIPGSFSGDGGGDDPYGGPHPGDHSVACHEGQTGSGTDQSWNIKTPWGAVPALSIPTATSIGSTTATLGATVTSDSGSAITSRGTLWGTTAAPAGNAVAEGGTATGVFSHARSGLTAGTLVYYRGYATNSSGTGYSPDGSFYTEPSTQASGVNFTSVGSSAMTVNWTRGSGDGVIVLIKQGSAVNSDPADGTYTGYTANAAFSSGTQIGAGNYVVYRGTGASVAVTGLTAGTTYYAAVYEYKGTVDTSGANQGVNYKATAATGSQATTAPAVPTLTTPTATATASTTATLGANVTSNGGAAITARGTVWGTSANPVGNAVAEGGTATGVFTHARSSITAGTKIYYRGYATNSVGTGYSADGSFYTEPATQASAVSFTSIGTTGMTVNWTRGSGDGVIVLIKQGSAVNSNPVDGTYTGYTANATFSSGTQIGTGNYVVHKGVGTSVAVTGLTSGATYYAAVYEYKGTVDTSGADQGANYKPAAATGNQATTALPTLTTPTASAIGSTTATLGANVISNGGAALTARGTVWGTTAAPTGNAVAEGGTTTGVFSHARSSLTAGTKIYYRGYATNSVGTAYSADGSFYTEPATQASAVNFTSVGDNGMTVNWTRGNGDGVIVLLRQGSAVATDPADGAYTAYTANAAFGSGTPIGAAYAIYKGTASTVAVTGLSSGSTYYAAVYEYQGALDTSGVNQGANYKPAAATGSQATTGAVPPNAPTLTPYGGCGSGVCSTTCAAALAWSTETCPDSDATQYYVELTTDPTFATVTHNSGWIAATGWNPTPQLAAGTWYWHVKARDSVHTSAASAYSASGSFTVTNQYDQCTCDPPSCPTSCPILFTWDGGNYSYESDIYPAGKVGNRDPSGFRKPNPRDYYLLAANPALKDGRYALKIVEEKIEANYLDNITLYAVDLPENRNLYAERLPITGGGYVKPGDVLHTVATELRKPVSVKHVETGEDVTGRLAGGEQYVVLSRDKNTDFGWQTLEIDLGDLSGAPMIKLVIDGATAFPTTHAGHMIASKVPAKSRIEVPDGNGGWVAVPMKERSIVPRDGGGPLVVNITDIFKTAVYKLRIKYLYKTYIKSIRFDTTDDEPLKIQEVPLHAAELGYHGHDGSTSAATGEVVKYRYGSAQSTKPAYLPGNYTRFGDVTPLLTRQDDTFVIFGSGDEITLAFDKAEKQPAGTSRRFLIYSNGYYKSRSNNNISATVEPLPFTGMSNFPYDENVESYPHDKEHRDYLEQYNTRPEGGLSRQGGHDPRSNGTTAGSTEVFNRAAPIVEAVKFKAVDSEVTAALKENLIRLLPEKPENNRASESKSSTWGAIQQFALQLWALLAGIMGWIAGMLGR